MFRLTRRERKIVAFLLLAFLLGLGVREWRERGAARAAEETLAEKLH